VELPRTKYAKNGDVHVAYQVSGEGPIDVVLVPGWVSHVELDWEAPTFTYQVRRVEQFARLIRFDKRGSGLSDRDVGLPSLEERMDDMRAVMDEVGSNAPSFGAIPKAARWRSCSPRRIRSAPRH